MNFTLEQLFALLPAWMRTRDAEEGAGVKARLAPDDPRDAADFGPLRTLASLVAREASIADEQISALYDDSFIETCAPWVVPYLGDLLGMRGLEDIPEGLDLRGRVADALQLRARRGTLRALEHAAAESANLPVLASEYARRMVHAQSMRLPHPGMGAAVDFRDAAALSRVGTAFERASRGVEARRIDTRARGRFNRGNIGLHVWRLRPWPIGRHLLRPAVDGSRMFRFHPLGADAPLFDRARARPPIEQPASEADLPVAIRRQWLAENVERFYGDGRAIRIFVGDEEVPAAEIRAANLGDRDLPGNEPWNRGSSATHTLIDPELGRLVVGDNRPGPVRVSCNFARPFDIGGGEQARHASIGSVEDGETLPPSAAIAERIAERGGTGTFLLQQSSHYRMGERIAVPDDGLLRIVAADGRFPTVRLPAVFTLVLGRNARVELNGLRLHGGLVRVEGDGEAPGELRLLDCTLVPGRSLGRDGAPAQPGAPSLQLAASGMALLLERVVSGPVELATDVEAVFTDCILDAGSASALAVSAPPGALRHVVSLRRSTVFGRVETDAFSGGGHGAAHGVDDADPVPATSDTLFLGAAPAIRAARLQLGCIRFSLVPAGSVAPRLHRCPHDAPLQFESHRYADPGYFLLKEAPGAIRRGAEDGQEIGVGNRQAAAARHDNMLRSIEDFLRFGHSAGIFYETTDDRAGRKP